MNGQNPKCLSVLIRIDDGVIEQNNRGDCQKKLTENTYKFQTQVRFGLSDLPRSF